MSCDLDKEQNKLTEMVKKELDRNKSVTIKLVAEVNFIL